MKQLLTLIALAGYSLNVHADVFAVFRDDNGRTNWQYVANTSASLLILTLLVVLAFLVRSNMRERRFNRALTEIKATLEQRVEQRTAVLQETSEQLRRREAYIASIVNSMPVMLIGLNQQLQVTQWNKTAEEATGRPFASVQGMGLWEAYPSITLKAEQVLSVLTSGETLNLKHTQRGQHSFDLTVYRLAGHDDTGLVILISDITKQVNAENKVAERDKMSALGELASAMAYDINVPLDSIQNRAASARQIIDAADLGPVKTFLLQEMDSVSSSAQQASAIAHNLLDLARSHRDTEQQAELPALMDRSIALASLLFNDLEGLAFRDIDIIRDYAQGLEPITCYPAELEQVFVRLLRSAFHALKAAQPADRNPRIRVEIGEFINSVWIKVAHNGKGLNAAEQEDIFEPFFAIATSPTATPVEQRLSYPYFVITEHHHGHLSVTSEEDTGTCFNVQLSLV
jgi:PAS domain S-box-containing protein